MKISKNTIFVCFALCLLLQFGGCSLFSGEESAQNTTKDTKTSESKIEEVNADKQAALGNASNKVQAAKDNLRKLEFSLKEDREEIANEKKIYEKKVADSKNSGKDFTNTETETYRQGKKVEKLQKEYDDKITSAKTEVFNAETEMKNLQQSQSAKPLPTPSETQKNDFELSNLLFPLITGLAGLLLLGGIGYFIYRISKSVKDDRAATQHGFSSVGAKQSGLRQDVDQLKKVVEMLSQQSKDQRSEIAALKSQTQLRGNFSDAPPAPPTYAPHFAQPEPEPEFPVSVENYLAKNASGAPFGKYDPLLGTLRENFEDGAFYLVRDGVLSDEARYAVPRSKQFVTKDDFAYHYSNYYVCANPSGGEVWIKKPSTVRRTPDGWKLEAMGELEIR